MRNNSGHYRSGAKYCNGHNYSSSISAISDNYAGYYAARQHLYLSCNGYAIFLCSSIDDTHCFHYSVDFLQKANVYDVINYVGVRDTIHHINILAQAVNFQDQSNVYYRWAGLVLGHFLAGFALRLYEAEPGWEGVTLLRGKGKKGAGGSKIFDIERM